MFDLNFNAQLSKKYLELRGYIYSNKRFRAYLNLLNSKEKGFSAKVNTEHFNLVADGILMIEELLQLLDIDSGWIFRRD